MLQLRDFYADDVPFLVQYLNDEQVTRFITAAIPKPYTLSDAKWWIEHSEGNPLIQAVCLDGHLIGCISAQPGQFEYQRSAELGYWLASPMWRQGYGSHAVALFV
ncbi:MAG: GNAT family N-acetyltransferase [Psychrobium sp.]